jgi:hypothetical protein
MSAPLMGFPRSLSSKRTWTSWWTIGMVLFLFPTLVVASEQEDSFTHLLHWGQITGSLRTAYWSSSRSIDDREHLATTALWLKAEPRLTKNISLNVEGWVRSDDLVHEDESWGELREAYVNMRFGKLDLRVGKQIIVWGRADRLNPTDNLTPRNFTLLVPEDDDQRIGTPAMKAAYFFGSLSLTGVWLPQFAPFVIPLQHFPSPLHVQDRVPDSSLEQWAVKLEQTGKAVDWSLSYFDGFDLAPDVQIGRPSPTRIPIFLTHNRVRTVGADAATTIGRYGLRAEAAYTFTQDNSGRNPLIKNPFFYLVLGGDRTFYEYVNVNVQYFLRTVTHFRDPVAITEPLRRSAALTLAAVTNQRDDVQHGASLRVNNKWWNETLEAEIAAVLSFTRLDFVLRPKIVYAFTDRWKGALGADIFRGSDRTFFGRLQRNSGTYVELRYNF